jgi:hypothetical protein
MLLRQMFTIICMSAHTGRQCKGTRFGFTVFLGLSPVVVGAFFRYLPWRQRGHPTSESTLLAALLLHLQYPEVTFDNGLGGARGGRY